MNRKQHVSILAGMTLILIVAGLWYWPGRDSLSPPIARFQSHEIIEIPLPKSVDSSAFASFELEIILESSMPKGSVLELSQGHRLDDGTLLLQDEVRYALPEPQWIHGSHENYLTAEFLGKRQGDLEFAYGEQKQEGRSLRIRLPFETSPGDRVQLRFGDRSYSGPGHRVPSHPVQFEYLLLAALPGDELSWCDSREIRLIGTSADSFSILLPSVIEGDETTVHASALHGRDVEGEIRVPAERFEGTLYLQGADGSSVRPSKITWNRNDRGIVRLPVTLGSPDCRRVRLVDEEGEVLAESPPFSISSDSETRLYWGSLQNHTAIGGHGVGTPAQAISVARGIARLDFAAFTEHAEARAFSWEMITSLVDKANAPHEFVTFSGFEWTHQKAGHRHVVLRDSTLSFPLAAEKNNDDPYVQLAENLEAFRNAIENDSNALVIPHHTAKSLGADYPGYDWGPRDTKIDAVEIYSWHGATDAFDPSNPIDGRLDRTLNPGIGSYVFEKLSRGAFFAILGDGDQHFAMPGVSVGVSRQKGSRLTRHGLTGVWAKALDRESIFNALCSRRCYATTGARLRLDFTVEGHRMGYDGKSSEEFPRIEIEIDGTDMIEEVVLWRDGQSTMQIWNPSSRTLHLEFQDQQAPRRGETIYHISLRQRDGHRAWSSPLRLHRGE